MWRWRSPSTSNASAGRDPRARFAPLCPSSKSDPAGSPCVWDKDALGHPSHAGTTPLLWGLPVLMALA